MSYISARGSMLIQLPGGARTDDVNRKNNDKGYHIYHKEQWRCMLSKTWYLSRCVELDRWLLFPCLKRHGPIEAIKSACCYPSGNLPIEILLFIPGEHLLRGLHVAGHMRSHRHSPARKCESLQFQHRDALQACCRLIKVCNTSTEWAIPRFSDRTSPRFYR